MKTRLLICAALFTGFSAVAQSSGIAPIGIVDGKVSLPQTTLYVEIVVERQEVTAGPYARYAQKYLGVQAPLADKTLYEILSAEISDESTPRGSAEDERSITVSHMNPSAGFPKLLIDRNSTSQLGLEDNARLAADRIFKIRRSRYELITGEAGENVFGAGLEHALKELDRQEEEYLSLFLGKQLNSTVVKQYRVIPAADKQSYIICRFSSVDGLLPDDDLSGQPVVLEAKAQNTISTEGLNIQPKPSKTSPSFRIADNVLCRIIFNGSEIASTTLPVYQAGRTVYIAQ